AGPAGRRGGRGPADTGRRALRPVPELSGPPLTSWLAHPSSRTGAGAAGDRSGPTGACGDTWMRGHENTKGRNS
ncbi:hypothetical protein, partial [Streptomyces aureus]|uniref:hypothetical protein n=1 Tax=Streptomyces aureus TaxID=193461 RepID=UPI003488A826